MPRQCVKGNRNVLHPGLPDVLVNGVATLTVCDKLSGDVLVLKEELVRCNRCLPQYCVGENIGYQHDVWMGLEPITSGGVTLPKAHRTNSSANPFICTVDRGKKKVITSVHHREPMNAGSEESKGPWRPSRICVMAGSSPWAPGVASIAVFPGWSVGNTALTLFVQ
jgi:hypothetical protein